MTRTKTEPLMTSHLHSIEAGGVEASDVHEGDSVSSNMTLMTDALSSGDFENYPDQTYVPRSRRSRAAAALDPTSPILTLVGVAVTLVGFVFIAFGWARVAGLVDVWKQMPYVLSAGLPGLGLVMTGLVIVNVSARRQDGAARARQMALLTEALRDLQHSLDR